MAKTRLDIALAQRGLVASRSQAESWIHLGKVTVDGRTAQKPGQMVDENAELALSTRERYVSRAGLKLGSVAETLALDFAGKTVLDVGSSTGGFTDFALQHGAERVIAVDVGTDQLHPSLRSDARIELHEKTDIRDFSPKAPVDIIVIDVSFISLREILPHLRHILSSNRQLPIIIAMVKPQFEAGRDQVSKGVIKNDRVRRQVLQDFERWAKGYFVIEDKADSTVAGRSGNRERFYRLRKLL